MMGIIVVIVVVVTTIMTMMMIIVMMTVARMIMAGISFSSSLLMLQACVGLGLLYAFISFQG